jgi:hypothetical protein
MAVGMRTIRKIQELQDRAEKLGFKFANCKHYYGSQYTDMLALAPRDDQLPHYSRDAELWQGSLEELEQFLRGIEFARNYYSMLRLVDDKKIAKQEQLERNRQLLELLKKGNETDVPF